MRNNLLSFNQDKNNSLPCKSKGNYYNNKPYSGSFAFADAHITYTYIPKKIIRLYMNKQFTRVKFEIETREGKLREWTLNIISSWIEKIPILVKVWVLRASHSCRLWTCQCCSLVLTPLDGGKSKISMGITSHSHQVFFLLLFHLDLFICINLMGK